MELKRSAGTLSIVQKTHQKYILRVFLIGYIALLYSTLYRKQNKESKYWLKYMKCYQKMDMWY